MIDFSASNTRLKFGTSGLRGLVSDFNLQATYFFVKAFFNHVKKDSNMNYSVVFGHDLRPSSPSILSYSIYAAVETKLNVCYVGCLPTPAIAFYAQKTNSLAVVITGSHIPFDRNGIKFYRASGEITKQDENAILRSLVQVPAEHKKQLPNIDYSAYQMYLDRYLDFFGVGSLSGMRIGLYEHSSVGRDFLKNLLIELGAEVTSLGRTESFVPIDTEAVNQGDVELAAMWSEKYGFDAIISTDGDADRPLVGDEKGKWLRGDLVGILCAKYLKAEMVVTPINSNTLVEKSRWFKQVFRTKIGSPYVIADLEKCDFLNHIVVGFEANGGFLLGSDIVVDGKKIERLPTRDAVLPILSILAMTRDLECKVSDLSNLLPARFTHSDRIQSCSSEKTGYLMNYLNESLSNAHKFMLPSSGCIISVDLTDGFRATLQNNDVVHIRASGNAPELRCYSESSSQDSAVELCEFCLSEISHFLG